MSYANSDYSESIGCNFRYSNLVNYHTDRTMIRIYPKLLLYETIVSLLYLKGY